MVGALIISLCHSVLALSSYVWGISVITPLPLGEGPVGKSGFVAHSFSFLYRVLAIIL